MSLCGKMLVFLPSIYLCLHKCKRKNDSKTYFRFYLSPVGTELEIVARIYQQAMKVRREWVIF